MKQFLTLILGVAFAAPAFASTPSSGSLATKAPEEPFKREFKAKTLVRHNMGVNEDQDPGTDIYLVGSFKTAPKHSLALLQVIQKKYVINKDEDEIDFADTRLRYTYNTDWQLFNTLDIDHRLELTAPTSRFSIDNGVTTMPESRLIFKGKFWEDRLSTRLMPFVRYRFNQYKTTVTSDGSDGGRPLKQYNAGIQLLSDWQISDKITLSEWIGWNRVYYEKISKENEVAALSEKNQPIHEYFIDLSATYAFTEKFNGTVGYYISSQAETSGGVEVVAYDGQGSEVYISVDYAF